jgi:hypothetical protein
LIRNDGEERTYTTPDGTYGSVTAIISGTESRAGIDAWRESIGEAKADAIRDLAALTGTEPEFSFLHTPYLNSIRPFLDRVEDPILMEAQVWHPDGFAGTLDCISYLDDDDSQPTLLDWKTADAKCKPQKVYRYSLQLAAYRAAANHVYRSYGLSINRAVLAVAKPDEAVELHELNEEMLDQLYQHFLARVQHYTHSR